ncbi:MAG: ABC transporter substrate-binding protein [Candidatus Thorarchaeota archaeon]
MNNHRLSVILGIFILFSPYAALYGQHLGAGQPLEMNLPNVGSGTIGPYVDNIIYEVISQQDSAVLALEEGDVDMIGEMIDPALVGELRTAQNIEIAETPKNGYGYLTINCRKYPYNITAFRRALAYAIDKEEIANQVFNGLATPLDSCVPKINPFSAENQLSQHYYEADIERANEILDEAGFDNVDNDSFREAPNGEDFDVDIELLSSIDYDSEIGDMIVNAFADLSIEASHSGPWYYNSLDRLAFHGDYDMMCLGTGFQDFDVDWLAYEYWSEYVDKPWYNFPNFQNETYDSWRDELLYSTDYGEVYEAAIKMQEVLVDQSPIIVLYENLQCSAYRTDRFEGFKNDVVESVPGYWTNHKVHLKASEGGPFGGTFTRSIPLDVQTFNFMATSTAHNMDILGMLYDSLIRRNWTGEDIGWLAKRYSLETHEDNPNVPENHTRITFELHPNVFWNDGKKLTAHDVTFTFNYYRWGIDNPYGTGLQNMTHAVAIGNTTVEVEFETESYWHLHSIGYKPILPGHVLTHMDPKKWMEWDPDPREEEMVTSGPFNITGYRDGEYYNISYNPNYFHNAREYGPAVSHPEDIYCDFLDFIKPVVWEVADLDSGKYYVELGGTTMREGVWNSPNDSIVVQTGTLPPGTHNLTLVIADSQGNTAHDTVLVYVIGPIAVVATIAAFAAIGAAATVVVVLAYQEYHEMNISREAS